MSQLTYSHTLVAGQPEDVNDVQDMFTDVATVVNGALDTSNFATSAKPVTLLGAFRTVDTAQGIWHDALISSTYALKVTGDNVAQAMDQLNKVTPFAATDYAVSGLTAKGRLRMTILVNSVAPTRTFTAGIYPLSSVGGGADALVPVAGAVVSGSTVAIASPLANTQNIAVGSDFTLPADGAYIYAVAISGAIAANSYGQISIRFDIHYV